MSNPVAQVLDRVSWMEWDEKLRLFDALCEYLGESATLRRTAARFGNDGTLIRRRLESLHWEDAWSSFEAGHLSRLFDVLGVDCVFDVGANEGQYAERLRNDVGYTGLLCSFEPVPALAERLRAKAATDPLWHVEERALDRTVGEASFNVMASSEFSSLLTPTHAEVGAFEALNQVRERIVVQTSTLDASFRTLRERQAFERPFLKLDTQGHDLAVLEGATGTLEHFVGLQVELSIKRIYEGAPTYLEVLAELSAKGFELSALVPNNAGGFPTLIEVDGLLYRRR